MKVVYFVDPFSNVRMKPDFVAGMTYFLVVVVVVVVVAAAALVIDFSDIAFRELEECTNYMIPCSLCIID